jgi:hypothetical protein
MTLKVFEGPKCSRLRPPCYPEKIQWQKGGALKLKFDIQSSDTGKSELFGRYSRCHGKPDNRARLQVI